MILMVMVMGWIRILVRMCVARSDRVVNVSVSVNMHRVEVGWE
jgi:hypothetical protein